QGSKQRPRRSGRRAMRPPKRGRRPRRSKSPRPTREERGVERDGVSSLQPPTRRQFTLENVYVAQACDIPGKAQVRAGRRLGFRSVLRPCSSKKAAGGGRHSPDRTLLLPPEGSETSRPPSTLYVEPVTYSARSEAK